MTSAQVVKTPVNVTTNSPSQDYTVGGGQGGLNLPLPVPFNPGSRPVFFDSRPFAFFRLRNIAQCCIILPFFSRFPPPWESRFPPPLLPPPVHLPPPFLPVSRPPVPPHYTHQDNHTLPTYQLRMITKPSDELTGNDALQLKAY